MKFIAVALLVFGMMGNFLFSSNAPASALPSENLVIMQVQTGGAGSGTSTRELVVLFNNSSIDIDISDWCVVYSSAADNVGFTSCVEPVNQQSELWLESGGFVSFATQSFIDSNVGFVADVVMSGGMAAASGHVRLFDSGGLEIDKIGWGSAVSPEGIAVSAHVAGEVMSRDFGAAELDTDVNSVDFSSRVVISPLTSGVYEKEKEIDVCLNIDSVQVELPDGHLADDDSNCYEDFCPNLEGLQIAAPSGYEKPPGSVDCILVALEDSTLFITELLPNAPGSDTGQEFIEIFNPNTTTVNLTGYVLQFGPTFTSKFAFVNGAIGPGQYLVFSDTVTGLVLPNTNGVVLRMVAPAGNIVSETAQYSNASDKTSWALVDGSWIYTNQITPGSANKPYLEPAVDEVLGTTTVLAPCSAGKFRNPETNRCKTIETAVSVLAPCDEDEFRNPETNRCKKVAAGTAGLAPCKEGQERNPETNRCRNVSVLSGSSDLTSVTDVAVESTEGQLNWPIILVSIVATIAYMLYEWRKELSFKLRQIRARA